MNIRGGGCMETGVNSDILGYLKKRQSELEKVSHPMVRYDDSFRYLYAFGLGVMALGNMKAMKELQEYFESLSVRLCISEKGREQIITDINNYFDFRLTECIEKIREKEIQYCFVLDLYKIYQYLYGRRIIVKRYLIIINRYSGFQILREIFLKHLVKVLKKRILKRQGKHMNFSERKVMR